MTSWDSVPRTRSPRAELPPTPTTPFGVRSAALAASGALLAAAGAACLVPALSAAPAEALEPAPAAAPLTPAPTPARTVVFDYSADVAPNDVYDSRRAEAPLPVFRALGETVDVQADYTGPPARVGLLARLTSSTGWSASVPLADEVEVQASGRVRASMDLRRLEERAALVARQTEMPFDGLTVELVAVVRSGEDTWAPAVALALTAQQLRLTGEPSTLVVTDASGSDAAAAAAVPTPQSRLDALLGWRPDALLVGLALTMTAAGATVVVRRRQEEDEADRACRRLGRLLLDVRPPDLSGLRVVDVDGPDALARLAERYGLLVLHWTDAAGHVFLVSDEATAYRWGTGERTHVAVPTDDGGGEAAEQARLAEERRLAAEAAQRARAEARQAWEQAEELRVEAARVEAERRAEAEQAAQAWREAERVWAEQQPVDDAWTQAQRDERDALEDERAEARQPALPAPRAARSYVSR